MTTPTASSDQSCIGPLSPSNQQQQTSTTLTCESFQLDMLKNLLLFRNENLFTDICIYVDGVEFKCHKVILCAASTYFKAMFSCDLKENRLGKVFIENITPWTMKRLIDFIYTSKIDINDDNVIDVFNGACMFNLYNLIDKCSVYIEENIDLTNCIDLYLFSDLYNLDKLKIAAYQFIIDNFIYLYESKTQDYCKLNEQTFYSILKTDNLNISKEIYVFNALIKWINYALDARLKCLDSFVRLIRFNSFKKDELEWILQNEKLIRSNGDVLKFVQKFYDMSNEKSFLGVYKLRPSTMPRDYLCILNIRDFKVYDFLKSKIDSLDYWPIKSDDFKADTLKGFSTCILNNHLYVIGGMLGQRDLTSQVWRFDPINCKWTKCCSLLDKRAFHMSLPVSCSNETSRNYILVLYGIMYSNTPGQQYVQSQSIEYYDILTDTWSLLNLTQSLLNNYNFLQFYNNIDSLRYLVENNQFLLKKSIASMKNMIYMLQDNCIHCYQFRSQFSQFITLPYFRLPENLSNLILISAIAVPINSTSSLSSSWNSNSNNLDDSNDCNGNDGTTEADGKYDTIIYLLNAQQMILYEFYPTKNKLKKLPNLSLRHLINQTKILNINGKVYITGGLLDNGDNKTMAIEEYDEKANTWSIFMHYDNDQQDDDGFALTLNENTSLNLQLNKQFFKLKMSIS